MDDAEYALLSQRSAIGAPRAPESDRDTGLNASTGILYNKFLAKLASDHRKPNGQYVITPEMEPAFVETLPVGKFHGIGQTAAKLEGFGIRTGLDIRNQTLTFPEANFGKSGSYYYWISRGIDERPVRANRIRKSVGAENTFVRDLTLFDEMVAELEPLLAVGMNWPVLPSGSISKQCTSEPV